MHKGINKRSTYIKRSSNFNSKSKYVLLHAFSDVIVLGLGLAGDDCLPLPMHPLVVGYDHEWMSVSPLSVPTWVR